MLGSGQNVSTLMETASVIASAVAETAASLAAAAVDNVKRKAMGEGSASGAAGVAGAGAEGLRTVLWKREWRVPCLDILVRL